MTVNCNTVTAANINFVLSLPVSL